MSVRLYLILPLYMHSAAKARGAHYHKKTSRWYVKTPQAAHALVAWMDYRSINAIKTAGGIDSLYARPVVHRRRNPPPKAKPVFQEQPRTPTPGRVNLRVPFKDAEEAKAKGAKWDSRSKEWYCTAASAFMFEKWRPGPSMSFEDRKAIALQKHQQQETENTSLGL